MAEPIAELDTGVYMIRNKVNLKIYVGKAEVSFLRRWKEHRSGLRGGRHFNPYLRAAWLKYGEEAFEFSIIECAPPEVCLAREQVWIDFYQTTNSERGYNICPTAGSTLGRKHSEETKAKIGAANAISLKGREMPDEHRLAISQGSQGKVKTAITRARMSEAAMRRPKRKLKPSHVAALIASHKGKPNPSVAKLVLEQVLEIRRRYKQGDKDNCFRALAEEFGVCLATIHAIVHRKCWGHI